MNPKAVAVAIILTTLTPAASTPIVDRVALHTWDPEVGEPAVSQVGFDNEDMVARAQGA